MVNKTKKKHMPSSLLHFWSCNAKQSIHRAQTAIVLLVYAEPTLIFNSIAVSLIVMGRFCHVRSSAAASYCAFHTVSAVFIWTTFVLNLTECQYARSNYDLSVPVTVLLLPYLFHFVTNSSLAPVVWVLIYLPHENVQKQHLCHVIL